MPRMIDADLAQRIADKNLSVADAGTVQWVLSHTPAVVCAEVVRCTDCRHLKHEAANDEWYCSKSGEDIGTVEALRHFCSYGERGR